MIRPLLLGVLFCGCAYQGTARDLGPQALAAPGWVAVRGVPFVRQPGAEGCGTAALAMVLAHARLGALSVDARPIRAGALRDLARQRGARAYLVSGTLDDLGAELAAGRPAIVGLVKRYPRKGLLHYEVVVGLDPARRRVATLDPARGLRENSWDGFVAEWAQTRRLLLVVLPPATSPSASPRTSPGSDPTARAGPPRPPGSR